jgi:hypothetical protein
VSRATTVAVLLAALASGCGRSPRDPDARLRPDSLSVPAPPGSAMPNLATAGGRVWLSFIAENGPEHLLQVACRSSGRWTGPHTVARGESLLANWADFPSCVPLADGSLAAHWLALRSGGRYAYHVQIARSPDGIAWSSPFRPHRDASPTEHGFVSLVPDPLGGLTAVWLDGRAYAGKEEGDPGAETSLRAADWTPAGLGDEAVLDPRVCDCCQTSAVRASSGLVVAYRDRAEDETRDIAIVRRVEGSWTAPRPLARDGWRIPGCPVNGPVLAASDDRVAAAWFTMAADTARVQVAVSEDGGATFSKPVRVDGAKALGRVDVALLPRGDVLVVWLETTDAGVGEVRARRVGRDGVLHAAFGIARTSAERAAGFPHVVVARDSIFFAWTADAEPPQVGMAALALPAAWR